MSQRQILLDGNDWFLWMLTRVIFRLLIPLPLPRQVLLVFVTKAKLLSEMKHLMSVECYSDVEILTPR